MELITSLIVLVLITTVSAQTNTCSSQCQQELNELIESKINGALENEPGNMIEQDTMVFKQSQSCFIDVT